MTSKRSRSGPSPSFFPTTAAPAATQTGFPKATVCAPMRLDMGIASFETVLLPVLPENAEICAVRSADGAYLLALILDSGCNSSADMPFRLVPLQHRLGLGPEGGVLVLEPLAHILVDRRFRDPELLRCGPDGAVVFDDKLREPYGPRLDAFLQTYQLPMRACFIFMRTRERICSRALPIGAELC